MSSRPPGCPSRPGTAAAADDGRWVQAPSWAVSYAAGATPGWIGPPREPSAETSPGPDWPGCQERPGSPAGRAGRQRIQAWRGASSRQRFLPGPASDSGVVNSTPTEYFRPSLVQYRTEALPKAPYRAESKAMLARGGTGTSVSRRAPSADKSRH